MFNRVIDKVDEALAAYDTIADIYTTTYNRTNIEETYLRSIYKVIPADDINPEDYRLTWDGYHIKIADKSEEDEYKGLVHEVYLTHMLGGKEASLQTISNVTFTDNEIFVAFEHVDGITFEKLIQSNGIYNILDAFNSLFSQLSYLYENYNFTHYDLHNDNVLVDKDNNVTIIDLQYSYANIDGIDYGVTLYDDTPLLITPSSYWPFDIYKLLMYCRAVSKGDVTTLINAMLIFFIDPTKYDEIKLFNSINCPPRIDYMPAYTKYLTSFDLYYEYFLNIRESYM